MINKTFISSTIISLLISCATFSQTVKKSVEIKGKLENSNNEKIFITFGSLDDSIRTDKQGNFYYRTSKINQPIQAVIKIGKRIQLTSYLAPGFKISLKANAENVESFYNSLQLSGIGSKTNEYWKQFYLLYKNQLIPGSNKWYDIKPASFVAERLSKPNLDSFGLAINETIFDNTNKEPYEAFFKKASDIHLKFRKFYWLFQYADWNSLNIEQTDSLIKQSINPTLFHNLSFDNYLFIDNYRNTIEFLYPSYLVKKDINDNKEILKRKTERKLEIADSLYRGKTRDYVLHHMIKGGIAETFSSKELTMFKSFISKINDKNYRTQLLTEYNRRKSSIANVNVGKEAPVFNLPDTGNQKHSLQGFKGKVVYIDLWASWCGYCIEEMPALKKVYEQYNGSGKLQIISIAVHDNYGKEKRHKIINKLQLNWLQLEDQDDFVWNKYKITSIPRFILIDKEGKIISFDAPSPSDKAKLKKALDDAIAN